MTQKHHRIKDIHCETDFKKGFWFCRLFLVILRTMMFYILHSIWKLIFNLIGKSLNSWPLSVSLAHYKGGVPSSSLSSSSSSVCHSYFSRYTVLCTGYRTFLRWLCNFFLFVCNIKPLPSCRMAHTFLVNGKPLAKKTYLLQKVAYLLWKTIYLTQKLQICSNPDKTMALGHNHNSNPDRGWRHTSGAVDFSL